MQSLVKLYEAEDDELQLRSVGWPQQIIAETFGNQTNVGLKSLLAHNDSYISYLFILLSKEGTAYVDSVWELLSTLPSNQKMLSEITALEKVDVKKLDAWNSLLDSTSTYKLLYSLQIVQRIVTPQEAESAETEKTRKAWIGDFIKKGGVSHVYFALLNLSVNEIQNPLSRACFQLIFKLLCLIHSSDNSISEATDKDKIIEKIVFLLEAFAHHSRDILYGSNIEDKKASRILKRSKQREQKKDTEDSKKAAEAEAEASILKSKNNNKNKIIRFI